jgi:hypothetical protein
MNALAVLLCAWIVVMCCLAFCVWMIRGGGSR